MRALEEETRMLAYRLREAKERGDEVAYFEIRNEMTLKHIGLVYHVLERRDRFHDDMIAEGTLGLMHAIEKFDPDRKTLFSPYARRWILAYMQVAYRDYISLIHIPSYIYRKEKGHLAQSTIRDEVEQAAAVAMSIQPLDVIRDTIIGRASAEADEGAKPPSAAILQLRECLAQLSEKDRSYLSWKFGLEDAENHQQFWDVRPSTMSHRVNTAQDHLRKLYRQRGVMAARGACASAVGVRVLPLA